MANVTCEAILYTPDRKTVEAILSMGFEILGGERCIRRRIDYWSHALLGSRYGANTLSGPFDETETLSISVDRFDCVTYCDFVYAASLSNTLADFSKYLILLRYFGAISWRNRNHYTSDWIRRGKARGVFRADEFPGRVEAVTKRLSVIPSLPKRDVSISYHAYDTRGDWMDCIQSGDFIAFGSNRYELDVFHCGIVFRSDEISIRHASRAGGGVIEDLLERFMSGNTGCGILLASPAPLAPTPSPIGQIIVDIGCEAIRS